MNPRLIEELKLLSGVLLVSVTSGLLISELPTALALAAVVYCAYHLYNLVWLSHLLINNLPIKPPYPYGFWGLIHQEIDANRNRSRKFKDRLKRYTSRFRKVATLVPDAYVLIEKSNRIEWSNLAAKNLLNVRSPNDEGMYLNQIIDNPILSRYLEEADYRDPLEFVSPINKAVILSVTITPFGKKKKQQLLVAKDVTGTYQLNRMRRDFVSNVSHELKTPLTVIKGYLESLSDYQSDDTVSRPFHLMLNQTSRMETIINDLLTLSRLEHSEKPVDMGPVDVAALIDKIIDQSEPLAQNKGHYSLIKQIDDEIGIEGDEAELESAFSNLLLNAYIHTPPGTQIEIFWGRDQDLLCYWVKDNGPGIPDQHIPRITERFYRVDEARSRKSGGSGLGLAIVKHIINRHEGRLAVTSHIGHGSQFSCQFPLHRQVMLHMDQQKNQTTLG